MTNLRTNFYLCARARVSIFLLVLVKITIYIVKLYFCNHFMCNNIITINLLYTYILGQKIIDIAMFAINIIKRIVCIKATAFKL